MVSVNKAAVTPANTVFTRTNMIKAAGVALAAAVAAIGIATITLAATQGANSALTNFYGSKHGVEVACGVGGGLAAVGVAVGAATIYFTRANKPVLSRKDKLENISKARAKAKATKAAEKGIQLALGRRLKAVGDEIRTYNNLKEQISSLPVTHQAIKGLESIDTMLLKLKAEYQKLLPKSVA
jgi:hypothetical protein